MDRLKDKVAIITGASSGIGWATAKLFAHEGAKVVVAGRRDGELDRLVSEIVEDGGRAVCAAGDVRSEAHAQDLVNVALREFGGLDIAFNNAGMLGEMGATPETSLDGWRETLDVNLTGAYLGAKHQIPAMVARGAGSIIFTSSFVGNTVGFPGVAAYAASKAGLVGLTQALAAEYGAQGLRVNALLPGGTDTPMARAFAQSAQELDFIKSLYALKRLATPEEIAQSALYLASDASSFTTGTAMLVDGGVSINRT